MERGSRLRDQIRNRSHHLIDRGKPMRNWFATFFGSPDVPRIKLQAKGGSTRASRWVLEPLEDRRVLSFSPVATYPADGPRAIDAGDFDQDGDTDLVSVNQYQDL